MGLFLTMDFWLGIAERGFRILVICLLALTALKLLAPVARRIFIPKVGPKAFHLDEKRARTLSSLFQSILRYFIYFIAMVMLLQELHIDTTSLVAGAGVIGLAVGVGAQSLIKDFVTGFFIILEDQYAVGDYIHSGELSGTVEEVGFRTTKLRDSSGILHFIPNGTIARVSNYSRGHMQAEIHVPVAYAADIDEVLALLAAVCEEVKRSMEEVLEGPSVVGIIELRTSEAVVKVSAKTVPLTQAKVETALRYRIRQRFAAENIPMPPVSVVRGE